MLFTAGSPSAVLLLGKGDGTLQPGRAINLGGRFGCAAAADLDGDGKLDLAATGSGLRAIYGRGDGTFEPPRASDAGGAPGVSAVGDFDRDGRPDLGVTHADCTDLRVLRGAGGRAFARPVSVPAVSGIARPWRDRSHPSTPFRILGPGGPWPAARGRPRCSSGASDVPVPPDRGLR